MDAADSDLVLIGWAYGATDIAFARAAFDAAEIPVFVLGADVHAMLSHAAVAMGGARVMVFRRDVEAGLSVLESCRFEPASLFGWGRIWWVVLLSLVFGAMPMPYRAVHPREPSSLQRAV